MFTGTPTKRPADALRNHAGYSYSDSRFLYGDTEIDVVLARFLIYLPTYLHILNIPASQVVRSQIMDALRSGYHVVFYDWDSNFTITNPMASFSHSAILAAWFNGSLEQQFLQPARRYIKQQIGPGAVPDFRTLTHCYQRFHEFESKKCKNRITSA